MAYHCIMCGTYTHIYIYIYNRNTCTQETAGADSAKLSISLYWYELEPHSCMIILHSQYIEDLMPLFVIVVKLSVGMAKRLCAYSYLLTYTLYAYSYLHTYIYGLSSFETLATGLYNSYNHTTFFQSAFSIIEKCVRIQQMNRFLQTNDDVCMCGNDLKAKFCLQYT